jgi:hypothetical protein
MLQNVVTPGNVMDEEARSAQSPYDLFELRRRQARAHAGMATRIFSFTGGKVNFESLGIGSPSLRRLSK